MSGDSSPHWALAYGVHAFDNDTGSATAASSVTTPEEASRLASPTRIDESLCTVRPQSLNARYTTQEQVQLENELENEKVEDSEQDIKCAVPDTMSALPSAALPSADELDDMTTQAVTLEGFRGHENQNGEQIQDAHPERAAWFQEDWDHGLDEAEEESLASKRQRLDTSCTSVEQVSPPPPPPAPSPAIATTNSASQSQAPAVLPAMPAWKVFVAEEWVKQLVAGSVQRAEKGDAACKEMATILVKEFGARPGDGAVCKLVYIERALLVMASTPCKDTRLTGPPRPVVELDLLPDEVGGVVARVLRPGRCYHVHDPLAYNCILRELQRIWCAWCHGTKGITEMLDIVGIGPPKGARAHTVRNDKHRGPASTDPDKVHPDGPSHWRKSARDGLYFRRYVYHASRVVQAGTVDKTGGGGKASSNVGKKRKGGRC
ncbi:hypothetical protein T484DRAFT_1844752 [Baffinella frigidus]|nr:hypothetical protein T484DRAFT_1844752 [Cryptophyta sp. CCMP2293]